MQEKIPMKVKLCVLGVTLSEQLMAFMIPTIIVYMTQAVLHNDKSSDLSFFVGLQESLNRLVSAIGVLLWSTMSDYLGRKQTLIISMFGVAVTSFGTGLSGSITSLVIWRACAGFFAGSVSIIKASIRDLSTPSNISELYGYYGSGYGVGSILGPLVGAFLSKPADTLPSVFKSDFFKTYPFFFPFAIHSVLSISTLVFVYLSLPSKKKSESRSGKICVLRVPAFLIACIIFSIHGFIQYSYRTLFSLWLSADSKYGGMEIDSVFQVGLMNSASGIIIAILPLVLTDRISKRFGNSNSMVIIELVMIPVLLLYPLEIHADGAVFWVTISILNGLFATGLTLMTSFASIAVAESVEKDIVGQAVGISQAIVAIVRSAGSQTTANFFEIQKKHDLGFPIYKNLAFWICCGFLLTNALLIKVISMCQSGKNKEKNELIIKEEFSEREVKNKKLVNNDETELIDVISHDKSSVSSELKKNLI